MDKQQFNKPIFKHDCDKCEFIEGFMLEEKRFDLYRCESDSPVLTSWRRLLEYALEYT